MDSDEDLFERLYELEPGETVSLSQDLYVDLFGDDPPSARTIAEAVASRAHCRLFVIGGPENFADFTKYVIAPGERPA
jgi:hypothetical protein